MEHISLILKNKYSKFFPNMLKLKLSFLIISTSLQRKKIRQYLLNKQYSKLFCNNTVDNLGKKVALVLLSGGIDSSVILYLSKKYYSKVYCLEFNYQKRPILEKHRLDKLCSRIHANRLKVYYPKVRVINNTSAKSTVENLRESNLLYLSMATAIAERISLKEMVEVDILAGSILTDWINEVVDKKQNKKIFKYNSSSSPSLFSLFNKIIGKENCYSRVIIKTPLIYCNKREVVEIGKNLKVPFGLTWSCPRNNSVECGVCPQCIERSDAFRYLNIRPKIT